jgi:hypothetical protein
MYIADWLEPDEIYKNNRGPPSNFDPNPFDPATTVVQVMLTQRANFPTRLSFTVDVLLFKDLAQKAATSMEYRVKKNVLVYSCLMIDITTNNRQIFCYDEQTLNNKLATVTWDLYSEHIAKIDRAKDANFTDCESGSSAKFVNIMKRNVVNGMMVSVRYDKPLPTTFVDVKYRLVSKNGEQTVNFYLSPFGINNPSEQFILLQTVNGSTL